MKNLIPGFITEKVRQNQSSGTFRAYTMFVDISGFTAITERLKQEGKEGIEVLMAIIDAVFEPGIDLIYAAGGFISTFAGDAFMAIFPGDAAAISILHCAAELNRALGKNNRYKYQDSEFEIYVKQGLSYGDVDWGIVGTDAHKAFYFRGAAINACSLAEQQCASMQMVIDIALRDHLTAAELADIPISPMNEQFFRLMNVSVSAPASTHQELPEPSFEILSRFLPDRIIQTQTKGEFREIVSVFISFEEPETTSQLAEIITTIISLGDSYGGYIENLGFGDKGAQSLVIFGVPQSHENDQKRALSFALGLKNILGRHIRIGITKGMVFAGFKGCAHRLSYGVLGSIVNLSARMMMQAEFGSILTDQVIALNPAYRFQERGPKTYKGFQTQVETFELLDKISDDSSYFKGKLIGRETELQELQTRLAALQAGNFAGITLVYGEAGIGKSHLVSEFCERNKGVVQTVMLPCDSIIKAGFNPFKHALNHIFKLTEELSPAEKAAGFEAEYQKLLHELKLNAHPASAAIRKELIRLQTILAAQADIQYQDSFYESLSPAERYTNTLFAYKELFKGLSLIKPLLLWLDDIHNLDTASIAALDVLTANISRFPLMLIGTARTHSEIHLTESTISHKQADIVLSGLDETMAIELIHNLLGAKVQPQLQRIILDKSDSNPFYIEQIIYYLRDRQLLHDSGDSIGLSDKDFEMPESLNAIVVARIDQLDLELKNIIQLASVFGREVELNLLLIMVDLYESHLLGQEMQPLLERIEYEQLWQKLTELRYIFKHALLHEAIYEMQLKSRLRELHNLAALSFEQLYSQNPEKQYEIAGHYAKAGKIEQALPHYAQAGEWFKANYINDKALECFTYLIQNGADFYPGEQIFEFLRKQGLIWKLTGKFQAAKEAFHSAVRLATELQDKRLLITGYHVLAMQTQDTDAEYSPLQLYAKAEQMANEIGDKSLLSTTYGGIGVYYARKGEISEALHYLQLQKDLATELGDDRGRAYAAGNIGNMLESLGKMTEAEASFNELLTYSRQAGDKRGIGAASNNLGVLYKNTGDFFQALKHYLVQLDIAEQVGDKLTTVICLGSIGAIHRDQEHFDQALECYHKKLEMAEEIGSQAEIMHAIAGLGNVYFELKQFDQAVEHFHRQYEMALAQDNPEDLSISLDNMSRAMRSQGRLEEALSFAKRALEIDLQGQDVHSISTSWGSVGKVYRLLGDHQAALECLQNQLALARESHSMYSVAVSAYNIADLLSEQKEYEQAIIYLDEAIQIGTELNLSYLTEFRLLHARITLEKAKYIRE